MTGFTASRLWRLKTANSVNEVWSQWRCSRQQGGSDINPKQHDWLQWEMLLACVRAISCGVLGCSHMMEESSDSNSCICRWRSGCFISQLLTPRKTHISQWIPKSIYIFMQLYFDTSVQNAGNMGEQEVTKSRGLAELGRFNKKISIRNNRLW